VDAWTRSCDLFLNFGIPFVSPERIKLVFKFGAIVGDCHKFKGCTIECANSDNS